MQRIFFVISLLILIPIMIAWHFHDMDMFLILVVLDAFVIISSSFVKDQSW